MAETFMIMGGVFLAVSFGILQFAFLRYVYRQNELWLFGVSVCLAVGWDCIAIGCCFL
jgi:hypothetical protein